MTHSNSPAAHWRDLLSSRYDTQGTPVFTHWISQRVGSVLAAASFRAGISANSLTMLGLVNVLLGCVFYLRPGESLNWIYAAAFWQLGYAFDCADGQLARATRTNSAYGAWLDLACDHVREVVVAASVFYVLVRDGVDLEHALAATTMMSCGALVYLQTASNLKSNAYPSLGLLNFKQLARTVLRTIVDTPLHITMLAALQLFPRGLLAYVAGYGLLQGTRAILLAWRRMNS